MRAQPSTPPGIRSPASTAGDSAWSQYGSSAHHDNVPTPQSEVSVYKEQASSTPTTPTVHSKSSRSRSGFFSNGSHGSADKERSNPAVIQPSATINVSQLASSTPWRSHMREAQQSFQHHHMSTSQPPRTQPLGSLSSFRDILNALPDTCQDLQSLGIIDDRVRQKSIVQASTPMPNNAAQPQTPALGEPSTRGFHRPANAPSDSNLPPIYWPMYGLLATGTSYLPGVLDGLNPAHPYAHGVEQATQTTQQVPFSNPDVGPVARIERHFSPYYQGDIFLSANQSENIPDDKNCSLFIVNLPPNLTTHELLAAIHRMGPTGRIFAIHINGPEPQRNHPGCAAKVVFFKRDVAHAVYRLCELNGFQVSGQGARVMWNRIKTSEKPHLAGSDASRVLLIGGPPSEVNSTNLTDFFRLKLEFQVDRIITHVQGSQGSPGKETARDAVIEYRFGSFRCQAQAAKMALAREKPYIRCFFAKDPLEPEAYKPYEYFNFSTNV
ncbi:unnamed protein product [Discula destructiva]